MKIKISTDGKLYNSTWDVVQQDSVFEAKTHLSIERGDEKKDLVFESKEEMNRFEQRVSMCRTKDSNGNTIYITGF